MIKSLILLGLIPVLLGIGLRKWFGERVLKRLPVNSTRLTSVEFLERLRKEAKLAMEVKQGRRSRLTADTMILSREMAAKDTVIPLAEAGLMFGLALLGRTQPELLRWRQWALKFSWAFPAFLILVAIFAAVVGSFVPWILPAISLGLGIGTLVSFLVAWIEWQAAGLTAKFLKNRGIVPRDDDRLAIFKAMKALAARRCVPGMLQMIFPENKTLMRDTAVDKS